MFCSGPLFVFLLRLWKNYLPEIHETGWKVVTRGEDELNNPPDGFTNYLFTFTTLVESTPFILKKYARSAQYYFFSSSIGSNTSILFISQKLVPI